MKIKLLIVFLLFAVASKSQRIAKNKYGDVDTLFMYKNGDVIVYRQNNKLVRDTVVFDADNKFVKLGNVNVSYDLQHINIKRSKKKKDGTNPCGAWKFGGGGAGARPFGDITSHDLVFFGGGGGSFEGQVKTWSFGGNKIGIKESGHYYPFRVSAKNRYTMEQFQSHFTLSRNEKDSVILDFGEAAEIHIRVKHLSMKKPIKNYLQIISSYLDTWIDKKTIK